MRLLLKALIYCSIFVLCQSVWADQTRRAPSDDGVFTAGPYYNPATKSYFELIRTSDELNWAGAYNEAKNHKFKNTVGHLATISRPETHLFLIKSFSFLNDTWIGLRFYCDNSALIWTDGALHPRKSFDNWGEIEGQANINCAANDYQGTFINAPVLQWQLADNTKFSAYILVEYSTGKR